MSEVPEYLINYYLPIAELYSERVEKFRPEFNNDGIDDNLNQVFYDIVMAKKDEIKILSPWERMLRNGYRKMDWEEDE